MYTLYMYIVFIIEQSSFIKARRRTMDWFSDRKIRVERQFSILMAYKAQESWQGEV